MTDDMLDFDGMYIISLWILIIEFDVALAITALHLM